MEIVSPRLSVVNGPFPTFLCQQMVTVKRRLADLGGRTLPGSAADFGRIFAEETDIRAQVIKAAGIKPDMGEFGFMSPS